VLAKGYRPTKKPPTTAVDLHAYFWLCLNDENAVPSDETLDSLILAIEAEARASLDARYAAQLNLTIKANSTIEDLREELHAAHEHRRVVEEYMVAPDPATLDVERLARALKYGVERQLGPGAAINFESAIGSAVAEYARLAAIEGSKP